MKPQAYLPTGLLTPFVKNYLILESQEEVVNRVLPDTSLVMAFRYKGQVNYLKNEAKKVLPTAVVSGLRKSGQLINYSKNSGNILVIFKETGAGAFLKEPLNELFDDSVALGNLTNYKDLSVIEEQLFEAADNEQKINLIEKFLLSKLCNHKCDPLILAALEKIHSTRGTLKMKDLANMMCLSQDAFEKRFRRVVGVSPKQFSYIIRMKSIVNRGLEKQQSLAEVAFDAGYFDQPHFNKDFKQFTGQTPTDFLKSPTFW